MMMENTDEEEEVNATPCALFSVYTDAPLVQLFRLSQQGSHGLNVLCHVTCRV